MNINTQKQIFKGWDAAPLKNLYIEKETAPAIISEMQKMGKKEKIEIKPVSHSFKWMQDHQVILSKEDKTPILIGDKRLKKDTVADFQRENIPCEKSNSYVTGGNSYIGRNSNGKSWMLIGRDDILLRKKSTISKQYQIPIENILTIAQPNFHIDMAIRPIGYPYILVNDFRIGEDFLDEVEDDSAEFKEFEKDYYHNWRINDREYTASSSTIHSLEKMGFKPIPIAGLFGFSINFMNGIVNQHSDGTISYITNSSKCDNEYCNKAQEFFERQLKEKVPNIRNVYFIQGNKGRLDNGLNYMMSTLQNGHGGIHCLSLEEPNFEIWG